MNIIYHNDKSKVAAFSHKLAQILEVKASRARELHAKSLDFNSNNHLIGKLSNYGSDAGLPIERYLLNLADNLRVQHKKELTELMRAQIESELSSSFGVLYEKVSVEDFVRFSLLRDGFTKPLAGFEEITTYIGNQLTDDMCKHVFSGFNYDKPLIASLGAGKPTDTLAALVKAYCSFFNYTPKASVADWLEDYKQALHDHVTSRLVHTYIVPIVARFDVNTKALGTINVDDLNSVFASDNREIYLAKKFESGVDCDYGDEDLVSAYCHPSAFVSAKGKVEHVIHVTPPKESSMQLSKKTMVPRYIAGGSSDIHFHIIDAEKNVDDVGAFTEQIKVTRSANKPHRGYVGFYPMVIIGQELTVGHVKALNSIFADMGQSAKSDGLKIAVGSIVTDSFSELVDADMGVLYNRELCHSSQKTIAELHQAWFELYPNTKWVFESIKYCCFTVVSKDNMYSPFGQYGLACHIEIGTGSINPSDIIDERYIDRNVWLYALNQHTKARFNHSITVFDNLDDSECKTKTQRYIRGDGIPATSKQFFASYEGILNHFDFDMAHNLVVSYERHDNCYNCFNLVGYDVADNQVLNITIFPFVIDAQSEAMNDLKEFLSKVKPRIKGEYEVEVYEDDDGIGFGNGLIPCLEPFSEYELDIDNDF